MLKSWTFPKKILEPVHSTTVGTVAQLFNPEQDSRLPLQGRLQRWRHCRSNGEHLRQTPLRDLFFASALRLFVAWVSAYRDRNERNNRGNSSKVVALWSLMSEGMDVSVQDEGSCEEGKASTRSWISRLQMFASVTDFARDTPLLRGHCISVCRLQKQPAATKTSSSF